MTVIPTVEEEAERIAHYFVPVMSDTKSFIAVSSRSVIKISVTDMVRAIVDDFAPDFRLLNLVRLLNLAWMNMG